MFLNRPTFTGLDSHYFLTKICSDNNHYQEGANLPLTNIVFNNLPCDFTTLKLILIGLYGLSLIALFKIGEITWKGGGFFVILFTGISTAFLYSSFKLENDAFAFPLLFFSLYFFLKFLQKKPVFLVKPRKDYLSLIISFILLGTAGMFWGGAVFYLIGFLLILLPRLTILTLAISFFVEQTQPIMAKLMGNLVADFTVLENNPLLFFYLNFIYLSLLAFGIRRIAKKPWYLTLTVMFLIISFLNPKLAILATPFISLYMFKNYLIATDALSLVDKKIRLPKKILKYPKIVWVLRKEIPTQKIFVATGIFLWIVYSLIIVTLTPTLIQMEATQETVRLSKEMNLPINNEWDYGHLIWYHGGQTNQHSGPGGDLQMRNTLFLTDVVLRGKLLNDNNCGLLKAFGENYFIFEFRPNLYLYKCN